MKNEKISFIGKTVVIDKLALSVGDNFPCPVIFCPVGIVVLEDLVSLMI
jgi:hypothetical protein